MECYLLRHAIAVPRGSPGYPDDDRPLTEDGIAKMKRAARGIAILVGDPDVILTSPLRRAYQTAEIVAAELRCEKKIKLCEALRPGGTMDALRGALATHRGARRIMLVGHEPDLGFIASSFLGSSHCIIEFRKGSLCRIDLSGTSFDEPGKLIWHLTPKHLRLLSRE